MVTFVEDVIVAFQPSDSHSNTVMLCVKAQQNKKFP